MKALQDKPVGYNYYGAIMVGVLCSRAVTSDGRKSMEPQDHKSFGKKHISFAPVILYVCFSLEGLK